MAVTLQVVSIVLFTFIGYLNIGIPLAVLPGYVHTDLGFGAVAAGLVISVQYLATLLSRPFAGRFIDTRGPKKAVIVGLFGCGLSGVFMLFADWLDAWPMVSLISLFVGRLVLGSAESLVGSGSIGWGIGRVGAANTAKVISWNGIASYGALAIGAPVGVLLVNALGLWSMGVSVMLLAALGISLAWKKTPAPLVHGERLPFLHVLGRVLPHGTGLALGSIGFGTIATFITLYYASHTWPNAVLCLSLFGACFIGARLLFGNLINRIGGFRVAIACLSVETLGLLLLWLAPNPNLALAVAAGFGFASIFLFAALASLSGLGLSVYLYKHANAMREKPAALLRGIDCGRAPVAQLLIQSLREYRCHSSSICRCKCGAVMFDESRLAGDLIGAAKLRCLI